MERDSNPRTFYRLTIFKIVLLTRLEYPSIKRWDVTPTTSLLLLLNQSPDDEGVPQVMILVVLTYYYVRGVTNRPTLF